MPYIEFYREVVMRLLLGSLLAGALVAAHAQEVLVDCRFEFKPLEAKALARSKEKEAMAWFNDFEFSQRRFVLDVATSTVVDGPGRAEVWRQPQVSISPQDIEVEWQFHAAPLDRSPRIWLKVNRFTGKAVEGYTMLAAPNRGPRTVYWARPGQCVLTKRQV